MLSGRRFAPLQSVGRILYSDLLASSDWRARHWVQKIGHWDRLQRWQSVLADWDDAKPYRALVDLDRRGILEGVIDETPFGHLQVAGL